MYSFTKDELLHNRPQRRRITRKNVRRGKPTKKLTVAIGLIITILIIFVWLQKASTAYAVFVNDKQVAIVDSRARGESAVKDFLAAKTNEYGNPVTLEDKIEFKQVQVKEKDVVCADDISQVLDQKLNLSIPGAAIVINGEEKVAVSCKEAADKLILKIKKAYTPQGENIKVTKVDIKETIQVEEKNVPVKKIVEEEKAYQLLTVGTEKLVTHVVKSGESLWSIARDNKMSVSDLQAANPQIKSERIDIGDEIKLTKAEPFIHIVATIEKAEVKKVPFDVEVISDKNMLRGKEKVQQEGKAGSKEFRYQIVKVNGTTVDTQFIEGKVLEKPVKKVVVRGSKMVLASRSSGGGGSLYWPARGSITSRFGYRGREYHTGLDIDGSTGAPIRAAEDGTVIDTGWAGNYGRMIKVNHGSGVQTWYAHLSRSKVKVGDKVSRGEVIGSMGSTGRSTGSHLHFEVRVNGSPVNPLKYLN